MRAKLNENNTDFVIELPRLYHFGSDFEIALVQYSMKKEEGELLLMSDLVQPSFCDGKYLPVLSVIGPKKGYLNRSIAMPIFMPMSSSTEELPGFRIYLRDRYMRKVSFDTSVSCVLVVRKSNVVETYRRFLDESL